MHRIHQLESHVADLIAAGEVVQRPASVVKELVENAIDAGSGIITIEIKDGGMTFIRVSDNGSGIAPDDVKIAFMRHATSKLRDAGGLEAIGTLGFRGEALAAIAAVSRIELTTREQDSSEGVLLTLEAGKAGDITPVGCPEGTTIVVRDLFFNTPARLKFIKSNRAEGAAIASTVLFAALSHPEISFRFIKDGKTEYHTPGDYRADSCIYSLLGRDFSSGLIAVNAECGMRNAELSGNPNFVQDAKDGGFKTISVNEENNTYNKSQPLQDYNNSEFRIPNSELTPSSQLPKVSGYVSAPNMSRGNKSFQFFILNGRAIRSKMLQAALEQAYANLLPTGRFPSCVLYITTKLSDVDVNVHPTKTEVKFASDKEVFDAVYYAVLGALGAANSEFGIRNSELSPASQPVNDKTGGGFKTFSVNEFNKTYDKKQRSPGFDNVQRGTPGTASPMVNSQFQKDSEFRIPNSEFPTPFRIPNSEFAAPFRIPNSGFKVVGEVLNTYIVLEVENAVLFIDKHAAHERVHFNALKSDKYDPMSQTLMVPTVCRFGAEDVSVLLDNADFLDSLGFSVERFGESAVAVRRIPSEIGINDIESILSKISKLLGHSNLVDSEYLDKIYRAIACSSSIKAGVLSEAHELEALATRVISGEITHCPHGRPVMFKLSKVDLDKEFRRI